MSKQEIIELLNPNAAKHRKSHSRKAKSEILKQLVEHAGYKSSESIIRYYSRAQKRRRAEKRGRLPKLHPNDIELIKSIWLKTDQPCGKRLQPMLPTWQKAHSERYEIEEDSPGHLYADTVAHCGDRTRGSFVWTLAVTDDLTLWTLNRAIWNKGRDAPCTAFFCPEKW